MQHKLNVSRRQPFNIKISANFRDICTNFASFGAMKLALNGSEAKWNLDKHKFKSSMQRRSGQYVLSASD